jgi:catechol 2,3-dioxygenase
MTAMPIPRPVLYPPFNIVRISHVVYAVPDLERSRAFYVDLLGLQVTAETEDALYLRALEERGHHSIAFVRGERAAVEVIGFKVFANEDLDKAAAFFTQRDLPVQWVNLPFQGRTLRTVDPQGMPIEFYHHMDRLPSIHQRYNLYRGARPLRIDHCNCFSDDVDAAVEFYNAIGFRLTEYTATEETDLLWAAWLHRKGGVHDIAFTNGAGPRLHHIAFWVSSPLNIIDFLDLMATTGHISNIERGPGRHGIANAFFLYVRDPDGNRIELYCSDYQTVDPDHEPIRWNLRDPQRQTLWGAPAPRSWFEEGSQFAGAEPREAKLKAMPIVAP